MSTVILLTTGMKGNAGTNKCLSVIQNRNRKKYLARIS